MYLNENVLVVAAHPDDEVLGCGGTIASMVDAGCNVHVLLLADGVSARNPAGDSGVNPVLLAKRNAGAENASRILGCASMEALALPDNRMDELALLDVVKLIESRVSRHAPTIVLTHHGSDVNIDHRVVHEAVVVACRPVPAHPVKKLLFFEVPSSTEWRPPSLSGTFSPTYFVDISKVLDRKMEALNAYASELRSFPHPRSLQAVEALARWRGATVGVAAAEAFILGREIVASE